MIVPGANGIAQDATGFGDIPLSFSISTKHILFRLKEFKSKFKVRFSKFKVRFSKFKGVEKKRIERKKERTGKRK